MTTAGAGGAGAGAGLRPRVALVGAGSVVLSPGEACDPTPFLRARKSRKYMGLQDDLAVVATGRALASAGVGGDGIPSLGERAGLFLAVGYIPFLESDIAPVLEASTKWPEVAMNHEDNRFDVRRFGAGGFQKAHPLLTFRCLPNMPAYHVSACFDVQGPYFVTYPGPSAFYSALDEARYALESGIIDIALVGAVAAQSNFLVRHHFARLERAEPPEALKDVAAMLVLEREPSPRARAWLTRLHVSYEPPSLEQLASPISATHEYLEDWVLDPGYGPAALPCALARVIAGRDALAARLKPILFDHELHGRDGVHAASDWVLK